jgi:RimJ/RimL family protein N-acetyltransferase
MNTKYKCLQKQTYKTGIYSLIPIRYNDRYDIMKWRNEQIYHLRQSKTITNEQQDIYFNNVVNKLFEQDQPSQLLFSFLRNEVCIGYGGIVHINWLDKNAEVSFVMDTNLESDAFNEMWELYLTLLKQVAFKELQLHKIYTYAYDIRPKLYDSLRKSGFIQECRLKDHCIINNRYYDVVIHSCINPINQLHIRKANYDDVKLLFNWVNDPLVRESAINSSIIDWENHLTWFYGKLKNDECNIYIFENKQNIPVGQVRIEYIEDEYVIDYSVCKYFRGIGLGGIMVKKLLEIYKGVKFKAIVKSNNKASNKVFQTLGFSKFLEQDKLVTYHYI